MIKATYINHMGCDMSVVNAARVSFGKKIDRMYTKPEDEKLIHYLAKHKHMSPFGHCFASFHVKAPIFVARQLVKHKFLRWNEISRRYVDDEPEFYEPKTWRGRAKDKKQGSSGEVKIEDYKIELAFSKPNTGKAVAASKDPPHQWNTYDQIEDDYGGLMVLYTGLLDMGVAPEQARMVLPQSTMTEWYWSGSLDAFADMCNLRCAFDTQAETRFVATQISDRMRRLFPVSWAALVEKNYE
jgi:thymidylate synthase (FAD)